MISSLRHVTIERICNQLHVRILQLITFYGVLFDVIQITFDYMTSNNTFAIANIHAFLVLSNFITFFCCNSLHNFLQLDTIALVELLVHETQYHNVTTIPLRYYTEHVSGMCEWTFIHCACRTQRTCRSRATAVLPAIPRHMT